MNGSGEFKLFPLGRFALKGKGENRELYEVQWTERLQPKRAAAHTIVMSSNKALAVPRCRFRRLGNQATGGCRSENRGCANEIPAGHTFIPFRLRIGIRRRFRFSPRIRRLADSEISAP